MVLGITALVVTVPLCALYMRRRPEDIGLRTDNDEPAARLRSGELAPVLPDEHSWTIRQAVATRSFWLILISSSLGMMCFMGILINFFAFATDTDAGFTTNQASIAFAAFSGFSLIGKLPWALPLRPHRHSYLHRFHVYGSRSWYRHSHQRRCILDAFALGYRFRDRHLRYCPSPGPGLGLILRSDFPRLHKRRDLSRRLSGPGLPAPSLQPYFTTIWAVTKSLSPFSSGYSFSQAASCSSPESPCPPPPSRNPRANVSSPKKSPVTLWASQ